MHPHTSTPPTSHATRVQRTAVASTEKLVTADMLNALPERACEIMRNDLLDYSSLHRGDRSVMDGVAGYAGPILESVHRAVNTTLRDMDRPLPATCEALGARLREIDAKDHLRAQLTQTRCPLSMQETLIDTFGKMMRKLANEAEQGCQQGRSI